MEIPSLKRLQDQTNKRLDRLFNIFKKMRTIKSVKEFEKLKEEAWKLAKETNSDVKFLNLLEKAKE